VETCNFQSISRCNSITVQDRVRLLLITNRKSHTGFCHISRANCAEITRDRLGQPAYKTFSIKPNHSFHLFKFRPPALKEFPVRGRQTCLPLQNTRIRPLKRQQPRETVAPSGVCECIVPNDSRWDR